MLSFLNEVRTLEVEGKIHHKLIFRVRMMFFVSLILLGIVIFNIFFRAISPLVAAIAVVLAIIGFVLGLFLFSRMNVVNWNEEEEIMQTGKMDILGFLVLGLYIVIEISFRTYLRDFYPASATILILSSVLGTLLGRVIGMIVEIHRVYRSIHSN